MIKKIVIRSLLVLIVFVILGAVVGGLYSLRAPAMMSKAISKKMHTKVSIEDIHFGWSSITLHNLVIANPEKSQEPNAFTAKKITVKAPLTRFLKDAIRIDEIAIETIALDLEFDSPTSKEGNWSHLMQGYREKNKEKAVRSVFIEDVLLKDLSTHVSFKSDPKKAHPVPNIRLITLHHVSSTGGLPMDQLINSVLGEMLINIFQKENLNNMLQEPLHSAVENLKEQIPDSIKSVLPKFP